ncbi:sodium/glutamate symporter [Clostridium algidicarnis]|uniref:sodium/glutamate symporter n=1 Tax=Clostridium algidicarnis TaxID=37659 RepID=UPI0016231B7C|nr:sodium/glutamate symporter [Clostridium algidicarnis]MBB6632071.1 hypothetical protein [Clostridium algidicarnis]MBU3193730.1 sodium/glutamate symporter [Clostridium algidicarnis]
MLQKIFIQHGTGSTFGALFEKNAGFARATTIAMASATFGIIVGSLIGGPIARRLITKNNLKLNRIILESK